MFSTMPNKGTFDCLKHHHAFWTYMQGDLLQVSVTVMAPARRYKLRERELCVTGSPEGRSIEEEVEFAPEHVAERLMQAGVCTIGPRQTTAWSSKDKETHRRSEFDAMAFSRHDVAVCCCLGVYFSTPHLIMGIIGAVDVGIQQADLRP